MTLLLPRELEDRLRLEASRRGMDANMYAAELIARGLGPEGSEDATLKLLDQWDAEEATDDADEIRKQQQEAEEFMESLARSRIEAEGPNARRLWP